MDWKDELIESQNKIIAELRAELAQRDKIIAELKERIAELERRLGLNSDNSSKPPSSDGLLASRLGHKAYAKRMARSQADNLDAKV